MVFSALNEIFEAVLQHSKSRPKHKVRKNEKLLRWGNMLIPYKDAANHFIAFGTTGSGKSTYARILMQSALQNLEFEDCRALISDPKQDALPILSYFVPAHHIKSLNPFDQRGYAWDLCTDLNEPIRLFEFFCTIFPETSDSNPFFRLATIHCAYSVALSYHLSNLKYRFSDLLRPLHNISLLCQVLDKHPETRCCIDLYFRDERLVSNLLASFAVSTLPYTHIASCWEHAEKPVSIQEWFKGRDVLILGNCEVARNAIDNVNRAILKAAAVEVLNGPETRTSSTWFFLDEISESGKHEILIPLAKKGRSKGAKLFLAVQSIAGLRNPKLYGPELTDDLLGQIGTKFIGRMECLQTAEYLSKLLGESRQMQASYSYTSGEKPTSTTSYSEQVRKNVLPSTLMNLTMANDENGITGYVMSPRYGAFKTHLEGKELFEKTVYPIDENVRPFIPRPFHQQILRPWNKEEVTKFGVDIEKPFELKGFLKSADSGLPKELPKLADDPLNSLFH